MLCPRLAPEQDEALRPFVAVLRGADSAAVREMTVQVVAQAVAAHPRGLGSGARPYNPKPSLSLPLGTLCLAVALVY